MENLFEKSPTCSCGAKMKLAAYIGYYDEFIYWSCGNCKLEDELNEKYDVDNVDEINEEIEKKFKGV